MQCNGKKVVLSLEDKKVSLTVDFPAKIKKKKISNQYFWTLKVYLPDKSKLFEMIKWKR